MAEEIVCPECGSSRLYVDSRRAEVVCNLCGAVVADRMMDETREPGDRAGGNDNRILPQLFYPSRDSEGRLVNEGTLWKLRTTSKYQNLKSSERATLNFESRLQLLAKQRGIPDTVVRRAIDIYHRVCEKRVFNKPNLTELALGLLLTACREMKYLIMLRDLVKESTASINKVKTYYYAIIRALGMTAPESDALEHLHGKMSVEHRIVYFAAKFNLASRGQLLNEAFRIARIGEGWTEFRQEGQKTAAAHCVAAAALYIAMTNGKVGVSQKEFCEKVNLSEISLRDWRERLGGHDNHKFEPERVKPEELDDFE